MVSLGSMTDIELVLEVQDRNSRAAMECLISRYGPAIVAWTKPYFVSLMDADDIRQEARLGFCGAVMNYDPSGSTFYNFARLCVTRRVMSAVRTSRRKKHEVLSGALSLNAPIDTEDDRSLEDAVADTKSKDPADLAIARETMNTVYRISRSALTAMEYAVLMRVMHGVSYDEIAMELKTSRKSVDNALVRARRKLREFLKDPDFRGESA